jgi:hypothetical protein
MSKTRKQNPKRASKSLPIRVKFKIGGRKSNQSAQHFTDEKLLDQYQSASRPRDRAKILRVIQKRKLTLPTA